MHSVRGKNDALVHFPLYRAAEIMLLMPTVAVILRATLVVIFVTTFIVLFKPIFVAIIRAAFNIILNSASAPSSDVQKYTSHGFTCLMSLELAFRGEVGGFGPPRGGPKGPRFWVACAFVPLSIALTHEQHYAVIPEVYKILWFFYK